MKKVLVLGAGYVSQPFVKYLLEQPGVSLTAASRTLEKAEKITGGHPRAKACSINVEDKDALKQAVKKADIVVSLLPWIYHMKVAELCLEYGRHMLTTSYIKPEMEKIAQEVKEKGLIFLNEIGVDPGIDHMAAMSIINRIQKNGGEVVSFYSCCGGLPALEYNNNPMGYKFSWSPAGVLLASGNDGRYLKDGNIIDIPGEELFTHYRLIDIPDAGTYEAYVNRDSLQYMDIYGIKSAKSIYRGTLRNIGHCESWNYFKKLGLLNQERTFDFQKISPHQAIARMINSDGKDIVKDIAVFLKIPPWSVSIKKLEWLGLFSRELLPLKRGSVFEMFAHVLKDKLVYHEGESDLLLQHHEFTAQYPEKKEKITSTMSVKGIQGGESAMSRTVGLPAAIGTRLILEGKISARGVLRPVLPEIYEPVLSELENLNIKLMERVVDL